MPHLPRCQTSGHLRCRTKAFDAWFASSSTKASDNGHNADPPIRSCRWFFRQLLMHVLLSLLCGETVIMNPSVPYHHSFWDVLSVSWSPLFRCVLFEVMTKWSVWRPSHAQILTLLSCLFCELVCCDNLVILQILTFFSRFFTDKTVMLQNVLCNCFSHIFEIW